jgi:hypothetical protein
MLALAAPAAAADDRQKAAALVQRAAAASRLSNLKGAYTLKISFRVPGEHGTEGTYQYWSVAPFHWRTEIKARGFHEVEVGEPDRRWIDEDLPFTPEPIQTLTKLVANGTAFDWPIATGDVRVKNERDWQCLVLKPRKKYELHACFDPATSLLRSVRDTDGNAFEFLDYQSIDGLQVPRKLNAYEEGYLVVEAKLESLATLVSPDPALLQPPPKAEAWDWCENMEPPRLIRSERPKIPRGTWGGESHFWVVIGTDGHVEQGGLMESAGPALDRAAAEAMKHWLFRPALCRGLPIRVKTTAAFRFDY